MSPPAEQAPSDTQRRGPRLFLVRHAAPTVRPDVPGAAWHLSPEGRAAADTLATEPFWAEIDVIHTSSEPKAIGTAQRIAARSGLPIRIHEALREVGGRNWAGEGYTEQARRYLAGEQVDGWEASAAALARFREGLDSILARHDGQDAAAVSHGLVLTLYLVDLLGLDAQAAYDLWSRIRLPDVAILHPSERRVVREFGAE